MKGLNHHFWPSNCSIPYSADLAVATQRKECTLLLASVLILLFNLLLRRNRFTLFKPFLARLQGRVFAFRCPNYIQAIHAVMLDLSVCGEDLLGAEQARGMS